MRKKYKGLLAIIGILLILSIILAISYYNYDRASNTNESLIFVDDELSINYLKGNQLQSEEVYPFSITNNSSQSLYYEISISTKKNYSPVPITYTLKSEELALNIENAILNLNDLNLIINQNIDAYTTHNFQLSLNNIEDDSYEIKVRKVTNLKNYFSETIIKNNEVKLPVTKVGEEIASTSEGLIKDYDDYGITYYFRGSVDNNYVSFANHLWRIVRINGDNTVRLVLDEKIEDVKSYNLETTDYEDFTTTSIYQSLQDYYDLELKSFENYIANANFCSESEKTSTDKESIYNPYTRLIVNKIPTFNCLGNKYHSRIGLMSADEVLYSGLNATEDNSATYLYNSVIDEDFWTSTLAKSTLEDFYPFAVSKDGKLISSTSGTTYLILRPVINIERQASASGDGTISNPYILKKS